MGKYSNHSEYFNDNGTEVPSVTTILKLVNKPFLVKWANIMGFKRQNVDDILSEKSEIGTMVHYLIEKYLMKESIIFHPDISDNMKILYRMYMNQFINWSSSNDIEYIKLEYQTSCDTFGGTIDFYGKVNGENMVVDFKTSKKVYGTMFLQLGAYVHMLEKENMQVDSVGILIVNPDKHKFVKMSRKDLEKYIETFLSLADVFSKWYDISNEDKWGSIV